MADHTPIGWTDATWNPTRGCTRVSEGCRGCYAEKIAARFSLPGQAFHGFADRARSGSKWTGRVQLVPHMLDHPLRWRRPRRIFVNSMSDLFHEALPDADIDQVFSVMVAAPWHTYQVLTKRPDRMRDYMTELQRSGRWLLWQHPHCGGSIFDLVVATFEAAFRHIWLGTSVEDQSTAEERIPELLGTPAAIRFLSCEPLLGPLILTDVIGTDHQGTCHRNVLTGETWHPGCGSDSCNTWRGDPVVHWVIAGGESGPQARPANPQWFRLLRDQCATAGLPFFFKQWGEWWPPGTVEAPGEHHTFADGRTVHRVGTKRAGNTLDGRQYEEFPA